MMLYPIILQTCGVIGSIIYVGGFALVQSGRTCGNGPAYSASKIIAALLVLVSLVGAFNLGAFLIQVGFIVFGVLGLVRQSSSDAIAPRTQPDRPGTPGVMRPDGCDRTGPDPQGDWPAISGSETNPHARGDGRPVQLCLADVAPAP